MANAWRNAGAKVRSFLWWTYPRGSLEYDIMVAVILAFIFLTPRHVFRDQPRPFPARPVEVTLLSAAHGQVYEILGASSNADVQKILSHYLGHAVRIRQVQVLRGDDSRAVIYNVWTE